MTNVQNLVTIIKLPGFCHGQDSWQPTTKQIKWSRVALTSLHGADARDKLVVIKDSFPLMVIIIYHVLENVNNKLNGYQIEYSSILSPIFECWLFKILWWVLYAMLFLIFIIRPQLLLKLQIQGKVYTLWYKQKILN